MYICFDANKRVQGDEVYKRFLFQRFTPTHVALEDGEAFMKMEVYAKTKKT